MVSFLKKFFETNRLDDTVAQADPETKTRVATCAVLVEMANADDEFTKDERDHIIEVLKDRFDLSQDEAHELIEIAEEELQGSIDIYGFTKTIKQNYSEKERIRVLEEIWKLVYTDGELSGHEDSLAHKLSFLLGLTHKQMIDAKLKAKGKQ
ncbi:MAG: TerB family tellurite resistance protein [Candidatus Zixiibacteriota bacterium]|nr:MAG: TerB family tellurite resistance protein [candidate division Zixibacteria bacterium]